MLKPLTATSHPIPVLTLVLLAVIEFCLAIRANGFVWFFAVARRALNDLRLAGRLIRRRVIAVATWERLVGYFRETAVTLGGLGTYYMLRPIVYFLDTTVQTTYCLLVGIRVTVVLAGFKAVGTLPRGTLVEAHLLPHAAQRLGSVVGVLGGVFATGTHIKQTLLIPMGLGFIQFGLKFVPTDPSPWAKLCPGWRIHEAFLLEVSVGVDTSRVRGMDAVLIFAGIARSPAALCSAAALASGIGLAGSPIVASRGPVNLDTFRAVRRAPLRSAPLGHACPRLDTLVSTSTSCPHIYWSRVTLDPDFGPHIGAIVLSQRSTELASSLWVKRVARVQNGIFGADAIRVTVGQKGLGLAKEWAGRSLLALE